MQTKLLNDNASINSATNDIQLKAHMCIIHLFTTVHIGVAHGHLGSSGTGRSTGTIFIGPWLVNTCYHILDHGTFKNNKEFSYELFEAKENVS